MCEKIGDITGSNVDEEPQEDNTAEFRIFEIIHILSSLEGFSNVPNDSTETIETHEEEIDAGKVLFSFFVAMWVGSENGLLRGIISDIHSQTNNFF